MTPTMEEVAWWLRELSGWFESLANMADMTCTKELNLKRAALWAQRAAQIDDVAMHKCCVDGVLGPYNTCTLDEGRPDDCSLTASGKVKKREQCKHWRIPKAKP